MDWSGQYRKENYSLSSVSSETVSFFRPLALLADSTLRPFAVDILSRKPCLFFLFLFEGWNVLFVIAWWFWDCKSIKKMNTTKRMSDFFQGAGGWPGSIPDESLLDNRTILIYHSEKVHSRGQTADIASGLCSLQNVPEEGLPGNVGNFKDSIRNQ